MKLSFHRVWVGAAGIACFLSSALAQAATFDMLTQSRSVAMNGQITLIDYDTGETLTANAAPSTQTSPGDFGTFDTSVGLGDLAIEGPQGAAQGAGRAAQTSVLDGESIRFNGMADVFMSGSASGNAVVFGNGSARSSLTSRFLVTQATQVLLAMDSQIGPRNNHFSFSLGRDDGSVLWNQTVLYDDDLGEIRSFSQHLMLTPGTYVLDTALSAFSNFENENGSSGRVLAQFSLTPVPEPEGVLLWLAGLAALVGASQRRRLHAAAV